MKLQIEELDDQESVTDSHVNGKVETPPSKFCSLERTKDATSVSNSTSEMTKFANRMIQKPKISEETNIFRDISNDNSFSISRRWKDVNTGNVKDRANTFLKPDENQNYQSPVMKRKIFNPTSWFKKSQDHMNNNFETVNDKHESAAKQKHQIYSSAKSDKLEKQDCNAPWRRNDNSKEKVQTDIKSPTLNLVSVSVTPSMS